VSVADHPEFSFGSHCSDSSQRVEGIRRDAQGLKNACPSAFAPKSKTLCSSQAEITDRNTSTRRKCIVLVPGLVVRGGTDEDVVRGF
jgi:hypothetical protein